MIQKRLEATVDDLYRVSEKAEIIDGEIVVMSAASRGHGRMSLRIAGSLEDHDVDVGGGVAFGDNVGFVVDLPRRKSFSPDAAWLAGETDDDLDMHFVDGPPTLAVEIRSIEEYGPAAERRIRKKIDDYFAAGTLVVWDVDPKGELIRCYRHMEPKVADVVLRGEIADAEPAVPGWRFAVDDLFRRRSR